MKKIVLISCVSKKLHHRAKVQDLYISPLFRLNLKYARKLKPDSIYILSAEHGLLDLDTEIEPYDRTLNGMRSLEVQAWAQRVLVQIDERADPGKDHFVLLAGQKYRKFLIPHLASHETPMEGLGIGRQLQYLGRQIHE
ncbi:DUF6884 domain-containing protein [Nitrosospira briensis]|uniref:DUF6884 domain-containing protein n=1 Tax=Nitrosospira briensis TaxID=35799 RepID=UPI00046A5698|nr:DUF6884 domain-containing protein [Nitrosospira briensis]